MNLLVHIQEQARRFNENEAIHADYERRRSLRLLFGPELPWTETVLDDLDWQQAISSCRQTRAISLHLP
jgi:hypothetical protein